WGLLCRQPQLLGAAAPGIFWAVAPPSAQRICHCGGARPSFLEHPAAPAAGPTARGPGVRAYRVRRAGLGGPAAPSLDRCAPPRRGRWAARGGDPATLASRTGAKVLPVLPERHGTRIDVRIFEPLDPADSLDLPSLRAAIAGVFEQIVLAKPEIVDYAWYPQP